MMIEGSGSLPHSTGSGSGRPENMWIRNTDLNTVFYSSPLLHILLVVADVAVVLFPAVLGVPRAEVGEDLEGDLLQGWKKPGFKKKTSPMVYFFLFIFFFFFFFWFFLFICPEV
jgi:hypothetical protein